MSSKTCSRPGCNVKHHARGMCEPHYRAVRRREAGAKPRKALDADALEDLEFLQSARTPLHVAAKRMGYKKPDTLIRNLYRKERPDLIHGLRDNSHQAGYSVAGAELKFPVSFVRRGDVR